MKVHHKTGTGKFCASCGHEFQMLWFDKEEKNGQSETYYGAGPICETCQRLKKRIVSLADAQQKFSTIKE